MRTHDYIISFILYNQEVDISEDVAKLENEMTYLGWPNHFVHVGPAIRGEWMSCDWIIEV